MEERRWTQQVPHELLSLLVAHLPPGLCRQLQQVDEFRSIPAVQQATDLDGAHYAAQVGRVDILERYAASVRSLRERKKMCSLAAEGGHVCVLEWAVKHEYLLGMKVMERGALGGHVEVLSWLRARDCRW